MNIACGTDIIEINRIEESLNKYDEKFKQTVFTKNEIKYCESHKGQKVQHYAARFAAKEAIFKALSKKIENKYNWTDFEIINSEDGKPEVKLNIKIPEMKSIDISLSHCKEYAVATVVVLF